MDIVRLRENEGVRWGLSISEGRKVRQCVFFDPKPLTVVRVPLNYPHLQVVDAPPAQVNKAAKRFKAEARQWGCTKPVAQALGIKRRRKA